MSITIHNNYGQVAEKMYFYGSIGSHATTTTQIADSHSENHSASDSHDQHQTLVAEAPMPEAFNGPLRPWLDKLRVARLLGADYRPAEGVPVWQCAEIINALDERYSLRPKWQTVGPYWGMAVGHLKNAPGKANEMEVVTFQKKIQKIFKADNELEIIQLMNEQQNGKR